MTIKPILNDLQHVARLRAAQLIGYLDYRRALRAIRDKGYSQQTIARALHISQPALSQQLKSLDEVSEPHPGFSGAGPLEICQRYAIGQLSRAEVVDQLVRWTYPPSDTTDGVNDILVEPPGSWNEVEQARRRGFIEGEVYDEILNRIAID